MTHATQDEEDAVGSLVKFELKKICSQRVTQVAVIVIAAFLAWVTTFNITSQFALDPNAVGVESKVLLPSPSRRRTRMRLWDRSLTKRQRMPSANGRPSW